MLFLRHTQRLAVEQQLNFLRIRIDDYVGCRAIFPIPVFVFGHKANHHAVVLDENILFVLSFGNADVDNRLDSLEEVGAKPISLRLDVQKRIDKRLVAPAFCGQPKDSPRYAITPQYAPPTTLSRFIP